MQNIETRVLDGVLYLAIDLSKTFGKTKTGKSITVGSSSGPQTVEGFPDVSFNLNVYKAKK